MEKYKLVSEEWLEVEYKECGVSEDLEPYFTYDGIDYFLSDFVRTHNNPWGNMDTPDYIHAYDCTNYFNPYFIEIADSGDCVRLYERVTE